MMTGERLVAAQSDKLCTMPVLSLLTGVMVGAGSHSVLPREARVLCPVHLTALLVVKHPVALQTHPAVPAL